MAMFWSKKPKAEKIYDTVPVAPKNAPIRSPKSTKSSKGSEPNTKEKQMAGKSEVPTVVPTGTFSNASRSIIRPRITEKSGMLSQGGIYTFEITTNANKQTISDAVKSLYKVQPVRVAIINSPSKNVFVKGRRGVVSGVRKAIVTLKKGDKIDFV